MKISLISDLHLDIDDIVPVLPGGELLIIAGDTCEFRSVNPAAMYQDAGRQHTRATIRKFFDTVSAQYEQVVMILGNHEHYYNVFQDTYTDLAAILPANFKLLERDTLTIGDVLIVGGTLWTNANNYDPLTLFHLKDGMSDFSVIKHRIDDRYRKFSPHDAVKEHEKTMQYLRAVVTNPANANKKIVVVSHHAPSRVSIPEEFRRDYLMNGGYATDLSGFILDHPQIKLWAHGHTHTKFDYMIGDTRVLCNPFGYQHSNSAEYTGFDPDLKAEV